MTTGLFPESEVPVTPLGRPYAGGPEVFLLRLDLLHPDVSGNKWFKLRYNLRAALDAGYSRVLTFGGPWSNHIAATAAACRLTGLDSIGLIRGAEPSRPSDTLRDAAAQGMELHFLSRADYRKREDPDFLHALSGQFPDTYVIPEGGCNKEGIRGCREILERVATNGYTHMCVPVGTGTTFRGLAEASGASATVLGFPAFRGAPDPALVAFCAENPEKRRLITGYDFGGFARQTPALIAFMQDFRRTHNVLLDVVYTAKMLYGIYDRIDRGDFVPKDRIAVFHTGGLQGNRSLDPSLGLWP